MTRGAVIAISHGGGPMPALGDPTHKSMIKSLKERVPKILKLGTADAPRAIVVVTAHWQQRQPTISSGKSHDMYYDYGGFPPESYELQHNAPGSPEVAAEVKEALAASNFNATLNPTRGWDHGVFIPFLLIDPEATVPLVQLSILSSQDPAEHIRLGRALAKLRDSNIAIVGSGFASFHHLPNMMALLSGQPRFDIITKSKAWNEALTKAVSEEKLDEREKKLVEWRNFPNSYDMHPKGGADHFMPLLVCAGAAGDEKAKAYADEFVGVDILSYYWD
ncbi:Extradiol aromatic ring-opening dioxygenase [Thozetella sp. PMI_491]|nr:Extradiol aromatic ring-opening dioxygenase [Thozetella sp. PMI_491]